MKKTYVALGSVGVAFTGAAVWLLVSFTSSLATAVTPVAAAVAPPPERIEVTRQTMLKALETKLEITTASMRLEKYVPGGVCDGNGWQQFAYRNCVTMIVHAKINAGFDWNSFGIGQIDTTHSLVTVRLGAPKIHDVVIDHAKTKVLEQSDGAFVSPDKTLQMRVLAETEGSFRRDACHNDILETAALTAEKKLGNLLRSFLKAAGDTREVKFTYDIPRC